ncbi:MAG: Ni/Fe-hydrogenase cytochrome b subunit [Deltaproteobacteria bacterium]|nr:Ni/Fe-hydrogenase cytochrome b subunit [Deltaproteobacteria bacterium]
MSHAPQPVPRPFWSPGVIVLAVVMAVGWTCIVARYIGGLGYVTNLDNAHPWGVWIGVDVASGVALAAGGFTTSFLCHILGRHRYEAVIRPALLTAALGYTFVALGVFLDIGRSWAIWKPMFNWNLNSALFEVAMCVMAYLTVLYIEFFPAVAEGLGKKFPFLAGINTKLGRVMWAFVILGVVLSCMHQSSLGTLMLLAPTKVHPLWYTPLLPLLFLLSAFAVGYPMVIFETGLATSSLNLESEMPILTPLSRFTIITLGVYLVVKLGDMVVRETYVYLLDGTAQSNAFLIEVGLGAILPWLMLLAPAVRKSRGLLFTAAALIVGGVLVNRINVFTVAYEAPYNKVAYFPSLAEIAVTAGLAATLMFLYRAAVTWLPVLSARPKEV